MINAYLLAEFITAESFGPKPTDRDTRNYCGAIF